MLGLIVGVIFVRSDRQKHAEVFEKEKMDTLQELQKKAQERDVNRQYVINNLKAQIVYIEASHALDTARNLSDLGLITDMLLKYMVEYGRQSGDTYDIWSFVDKDYSKVRTSLSQLGQQFFNSEVRNINSAEDLKNFQRDLKSAGRIVPIYQLSDQVDLKTYWGKISRFRKN